MCVYNKTNKKYTNVHVYVGLASTSGAYVFVCCDVYSIGHHINPCDYFLCGYLKSKVYKPLPKTVDDLKANIQREVLKINTSTLESTFLNFSERCQLIVEKNGGHFENK